MTCNICTQVPIGATLTIGSASGAGCMSCNQPIPGFSPQVVIYEGFSSEGLHEYNLVKPFQCPSCGKTIYKCWSECDDGGGYYEVKAYQPSEALLYQLPE